MQFVDGSPLDVQTNTKVYSDNHRSEGNPHPLFLSYTFHLTSRIMYIHIPTLHITLQPSQLFIFINKREERKEGRS